MRLLFSISLFVSNDGFLPKIFGIQFQLKVNNVLVSVIINLFVQLIFSLTSFEAFRRHFERFQLLHGVFQCFIFKFLCVFDIFFDFGCADFPLCCRWLLLLCGWLLFLCRLLLFFGIFDPLRSFLLVYLIRWRRVSWFRCHGRLCFLCLCIPRFGSSWPSWLFLRCFAFFFLLHVRIVELGLDVPQLFLNILICLCSFRVHFLFYFKLDLLI